MSNLKGKKPFKGKHYRHKKSGAVIEILTIANSRVYYQLEGGEENFIGLEHFYDHFGRIQNYEPPFRSELENK